MDIVLLFPGQGSQKPGMAADIAAAWPAARSVLDTVDKALATPLSQLMADGPEEELTRTHNAQPALLAHGAAVWAVVRERVRPLVRAAAGHSLGEFTAYHAAGALPLGAAAQLVRRRGELMYESGVARPGAMAAIVGNPARSIEEICAQAQAEAGTVVPGNFNSPGQVVISGEVTAVERAMALAKEAGAKLVVRLNVSGAFHSPLMDTAVSGLRAALELAAPGAPGFPVYSNVTAEPVVSGARGAALLLEQLTSPVRWTDEVQALAARFPDALYLEMGPGAVLGGLVKKIAPSLKVLPCGTTAHIETALQQIPS